MLVTHQAQAHPILANSYLLSVMKFIDKCGRHLHIDAYYRSFPTNFMRLGLVLRSKAAVLCHYKALLVLELGTKKLPNRIVTAGEILLEFGDKQMNHVIGLVRMRSKWRIIHLPCYNKHQYETRK